MLLPKTSIAPATFSDPWFVPCNTLLYKGGAKNRASAAEQK